MVLNRFVVVWRGLGCFNGPEQKCNNMCKWNRTFNMISVCFRAMIRKSIRIYMEQ